MEVGLWQKHVFFLTKTNPESLNPYCDGSRSLTHRNYSNYMFCPASLNPYCDGSRSLTQATSRGTTMHDNVLILIVMEVGLWPHHSSTVPTHLMKVLILIVMEVGLWLQQTVEPFLTRASGLNPYCDGSRSLTQHIEFVDYNTKRS